MRGDVRVCVRVWRYACAPGEDEQHEHVEDDSEAADPGDDEHVADVLSLSSAVTALRGRAVLHVGWAGQVGGAG